MNKSKHGYFNKNRIIVPTKMIEQQISDTATRTCNFNYTPPIIGLIISNLDGYALMVIEYKCKNDSNYGPIKSYLSRDDENLLELIPMYFSSLNSIAGQINIQNLTHFEIQGSNIKIQIYFLLDRYMIIALLNSNTELSSREKSNIIDKIRGNLNKYTYEFHNFNASSSRKLIKTLEREGKAWLKKLNQNYINNYKQRYLKKHDLIENMMERIKPVIQQELEEYLSKLPPEIVKDLTKELVNKVQDNLFYSI